MGGADAEIVTHLKQTLCQSPPDHGPQKGAKDKESDLGPGHVCVIQESPFGELQTAVATISPRAQHDAGASGDELQVSRHGLHFHRPGATGITLHDAVQWGGKFTQKKREEAANREKFPTDWPPSFLAQLKQLEQASSITLPFFQ